MFLLLINIVSMISAVYATWIAINFAILYINNKIDLSNGQIGYNDVQLIWRLAFTKTRDQLAWLTFLSKKGVNHVLEGQNQKLQIARYNNVLNNVINDLNYNFSSDTMLRLTNNIVFNGWYLYIPISRKLEQTESLKIEEYVTGVVNKYTQEFAVDAVSCQNVAQAGWCVVAQLNHSNVASFNRIKRQQHVEKLNEFNDNDELF